jgi:hypothetical protein
MALVSTRDGGVTELAPAPLSWFRQALGALQNDPLTKDLRQTRVVADDGGTIVASWGMSIAATEPVLTTTQSGQVQEIDLETTWHRRGSLPLPDGLQSRGRRRAEQRRTILVLSVSTAACLATAESAATSFRETQLKRGMCGFWRSSGSFLARPPQSRIQWSRF